MRTHIHDYGLHQPGYGIPSRTLLARADRGYARFLAAYGDPPPPPGSSAPAGLTSTAMPAPDGYVEAELPLDRETHQRLVAAVLGWTGDPGLPEQDYEQIALLLADIAHSVAAHVYRAAEQLPADHAARILAERTLEETNRLLSTTPRCTARCTGDRARLCWALYEHLDHLAEIT